MVLSPALASAGGRNTASIFEKVSFAALIASFTAEALGGAAAHVAPDERLLLCTSAHGIGGRPSVSVAQWPSPYALGAVVTAGLVVEVPAGTTGEVDARVWLPVGIGVFGC